MKTCILVVRASVLHEALKDAKFSKEWFKDHTLTERDKLLKAWCKKKGLVYKKVML